jgi:hypothetical protein
MGPPQMWMVGAGANARDANSTWTCGGHADEWDSVPLVRAEAGDEVAQGGFDRRPGIALVGQNAGGPLRENEESASRVSDRWQRGGGPVDDSRDSGDSDALCMGGVAAGGRMSLRR